MSSGHVAPHTEVHSGRCPPDSLKVTAVDACINLPPTTEAYRSQQFMDITDDVEGPPPYQDGVADSYLIIRDIHCILSCGSTKMLASMDQISPASLNQYNGAGDFILFQDEALSTDGGDVTSLDSLSSQGLMLL